MSNEHHCGSDADPKFFAALSEVMQRFPNHASKYHISCADHETEIMGINFDERVALSRIEGEKIVTAFGPDPGPNFFCCREVWDGFNWKCVERWV